MTEATIGKSQVPEAYAELGRPPALLDPTDPFDQLLLEFQDEAKTDTLPTQAEQRALITDLQKSGERVDEVLEHTHHGFVAAVAYPFKPYADQEGLMANGAKALMAAARTYDLQGDDLFYDYAIVAMRRLLAQAYPDAPLDPAELYPEQPMESLLHFATGLESLEDPAAVAARRQQEAQRSLLAAGLTEHEWKILPVIHLPGTDGGSGGGTEDGGEGGGSGFSSSDISNHAYKIRKKLGLDNREQLALLALEAGVITDVRPLENLDALTIRQRLVGGRLDKTDAGIATELGLSVTQVGHSITNLYRLTQARSRIELSLMAHLYGFEPSEEELAVHNHPALQAFTEHQRPVLAWAHLTNKHIADRVERSESTVNDTISRVMAELGFSGSTARTALVLELYDRGFRFDVRAPLRPLSEILTERELQAGRILDRSNPEIAEALKSEEFERTSADSLIHRMKENTGARTRAELALQIRMYDTGVGKPEHTNARTLSGRFFAALGIGPRPMEEVRPWLAYAKPRQAEYLEVFYFSEGQMSTKALAERYDVARSTVETTMKRGLENIRRALEEGRIAEIDTE